jgi:hypothetical protein
LALTGFLAERRWDRCFSSAIGAMLIGNVLIYLFGLPWRSCCIPGWRRRWSPASIVRSRRHAQALSRGWRGEHGELVVIAMVRMRTR